MNVNELTPVDAVYPSLRASSKKSLLQELSHRASEAIGVDCHRLLSELTERERLGSTGVGRGVAIPHCRIDGVDEIRGFLARLDTPVAFESVDDEPVDLVYLLVAPEAASADHLRALARISRVLRNAETCEKMRGAKDAAALHALLTMAERPEAA